MRSMSDELTRMAEEARRELGELQRHAPRVREITAEIDRLRTDAGSDWPRSHAGREIDRLRTELDERIDAIVAIRDALFAKLVASHRAVRDLVVDRLNQGNETRPG